MQRRGDSNGWVVPDEAGGIGTAGPGSAGARATAAEEAEEAGSGDSSTRTARQALAPSRHRTGPRQFLHEVNVEMRKVVWPTRAETLNYSTVVLVTLALMMAMIFGLDVAFQHLANFIFNP